MMPRRRRRATSPASPLQLGRAPHPFRRVAARCPWGAPAVVEDLPYDDAGRPFPTLFWATCPALVAAVPALESAGGVRRFEALVGRRRSTPAVPGRGHALRAPPASPPGRAVRGAAARRRRRRCATGIGGVAPRQALKCLHCHAAHALARPQYLLGERILEAAAPRLSGARLLHARRLTGGSTGGSPGGTPESPR